MKCKSHNRGALVLASFSLSLLVACSYATDFVVINESPESIEVRYRVKKGSLGPITIAGPPAIIPSSQLGSNGRLPWQQLSGDRLRVDEEQSTIVIELQPSEALRLTSLSGYGGHDAADANHFSIEEIELNGSRGRVLLVGAQARRAFSKVSRALYTLTYK